MYSNSALKESEYYQQFLAEHPIGSSLLYDYIIEDNLQSRNKYLYSPASPIKKSTVLCTSYCDNPWLVHVAGSNLRDICAQPIDKISPFYKHKDSVCILMIISYQLFLIYLSL